MSIITFSKAKFCAGLQIAERVSERLGWKCIAREVLHEAAQEFHVSEAYLAKAIHDSPSFLDRFSHEKEMYACYVKAAFLDHVRRDDVVYCGHAGHFFLEGIRHALKVNILVDLEERKQMAMRELGITAREAERVIEREDAQTNKMAQFLYHHDAWEPSLFDLVIHIDKIRPELAVDLICQAVEHEAFRTTPASQQAIDDAFLACNVRAHLINYRSDVEVKARNGKVVIHTYVHELQTNRVEDEILAHVSQLPEVHEATVVTDPADFMLE